MSRGTAGRALAAMLVLLLVSCGGGGGGDAPPPAPPPAPCLSAVEIAPDSATAGVLSAGDCTMEGLFPGVAVGDQSFVDRYRITLPSSGRLTIRMESAQVDSFLWLFDSASQLPPIAFDDDSDGNLNASINRDLSAGTYIILANTALVTPQSGGYSLTTTFAPTVWVATALTGVPQSRTEHTAVWTGSEMIIWGGHIGNSFATNTGARFNPLSNTWTSIATAGAPSARWLHSAIWTGTEMVVWGGFSGTSSFQALNDGAKYDPQTDTWTPISSAAAPSARLHHTAVWTGTEMIVWGGFSCLACANAELATGARYNPATNVWTATSVTNAPSPRGNHAAVWTGTRMLVWGGEDSADVIGTGAAYDPIADSWTATSTVNAPAARRCHSALWTGSEMIVFGGQTDRSLACGSATTGSGARYHPLTNGWIAMAPAPLSPSGSAVAVWTGNQMITWFGSEGARYNFSANTWNGISTTGAPESRRNHTLVWTGSTMIVWGGEFVSPLSTGAIYDPSVDSTP